MVAEPPSPVRPSPTSPPATGAVPRRPTSLPTPAEVLNLRPVQTRGFLAYRCPLSDGGVAARADAATLPPAAAAAAADAGQRVTVGAGTLAPVGPAVAVPCPRGERRVS